MNLKRRLYHTKIFHTLYLYYLGWYNTRVARKLAHTSTYNFTSDWVTDKTALWSDILKDYRGRPEVRMLEVGSYQGRSALWFLENILTGSHATLTCIDDFRVLGTEPRFDHNLRLSGKAHQVNKLKGKSVEIL